jgi:hypothetical protein
MRRPPLRPPLASYPAPMYPACTWLALGLRLVAHIDKLQAIQRALPVVASDVPAIVGVGVEGAIVPPADPRVFSGLTCTIAMEPDVARDRGTAAISS